jgi:predicted nucleic acid-binding protein
MSRIFWDTMMLVYLLEGHPEFGPQVRSSLTRSHQRGDTLLTSYLALGEVMAGRTVNSDVGDGLSMDLAEAGFAFLPFDSRCVAPFAQLRSAMGLRPPDSMNLACAAAFGVDLYLTGDKQLLKRSLHVHGIQFIAHFGMGLL